ncbi:cadherin repeat domain-containing protein [Fibrobacter sp. UWB13]|uniref:cadherin repeat domain-containing protein n=1 Tax=Fibrobacter sp. UWB13 TaxID=1896204 RepID=UPI000A09E778|nr:cadherin repeat domain-containing protein [Fibrobacter sp. UWB13]SMG44637.1 Cadherin domain-containing protein [Fibrobacter sp. UWB13]
MWFGKLSLKAAALVLAGAFSSAFAEVGPLDISADDWNYLSNFKLWGTTGIDTRNRPEFYDSRFYDRKNENDFSGYTGVDPDTLGWVGTAKGDLTTDEVGWFDGPVIVGGAVTVPSDYAESRRAYLLTGPIRTTGGIGSARSRGTICQGANRASSGACANVPEVRSNLSVPGLTGATLSGTYNVSGRTVLNVSSYCDDNQICDIFFDKISFGNDSRLVVQMPAEGQPTRIFVNSISFGTHPEIVVAYQGKGDLKLDEYDGNLLIYSKGDINFDNTDNVPIMGTIVSKGTIKLGRNMIFAGQFIANKIEVGNEIKAETFVFKKFDPKIELFIGNKSKKIKEGDNVSLDVVLSETSKNDVTFNYCFYFQSAAGVDGVYAGHKDVDTKNLPICGTSTTKATIPAGKTSATGINIKPLVDGLVEEDEQLWFQISDLKGAETNSDYEANKGYKIYIVSNDAAPTVSSELVINVNEDDLHQFTASEFKFLHATQKFASVIITSLPPSTKGVIAKLDKNGTITLNDGSKATPIKLESTGTTITVADLTKLVYQPAADDFGDNYTTFKYKVVGDGVGDNTSIEYKATINVIPVNDQPSANNFNFSVAEHPTKDAIVGTVTPKDKSNEIDVDTYVFTKVSGDSRFVVTSNGTVKVNGSVSFNAKTESKFVIKATVKDDAGTEKTKIAGPLTSDQFTITIKINNENDAPVIAAQTFSIPEKNTDGSDWPSGTLVPKGTVVATDDDGDNLTFTAPSDVPFGFKKGTNQLIVTDGSALDYEKKTYYTFKVTVTDGNGGSASANITVNITDVNEPPPPPDVKKEYSIKENSAKGTTLGTFVVKDYDKISGKLETLKYTLTGAITGAAGATTTLKNKTLADIFEVVEVDANGGDREVAIRVKNQALLDYEALYNASNKTTYPVTITIKDNANPAVSVSTKIAIQDVNEKLTANDAAFVLNEHSPVGSPVCATYNADGDCKVVAKVTAEDLDIYNPAFRDFTFAISKNNSGTMATDAKKFGVNPYDGSLYTTDDFDYETGKHSFKFLVTVSDGQFSDDAEITVTINDIEEPKIIVNTEGSAVVPENTGTGTEVDNFAEIDDENVRQQLSTIVGKPTYDIDDAASANAAGLFHIDARLGFITVEDGSKLDFEALYPKNTYTVAIVAKGTDKYGASVVVNINRTIVVTDVNEKPTIENTDPIKVPETATSKDGSIGQIEASDPDFCSVNSTYSCKNGLHEYGYNKLTYKVEEVLPVDGSTDFPFDIDPNTGKISVAVGKELNYTKQSEYKFIVKVMDRPLIAGVPSQSATAEMTIVVTDVNRPSKFEVVTNPYEVEENVSVPTVLDGGNIVIYDEDAADVNKLKVTITDNDATAALDAAKLFKVVQVGKTDAETLLSTFVIQTADDLDYEELYKKVEKDAVFNITLTVEDTEGNKTSQDTKIRVIDVNEEPAFTKTSYTFSIAENTTETTSLGVAEATDPDKYNTKFNTLSFSLKGEEAALFDIDERSGEIFTVNNAKFDYETKRQYSFEVVVKDKDFTKKVPVTVNVTDVSEGPKFTDIPTLTVDENTLKGTKVGEILATDDDCKASFAATCKKPTYTITASDVAPNDYKAFTYVDGVIKVAKDSILDFEGQSEYTVHLVVKDGSDPTLSDGVDVKIIINDVNDAPTYEEKEYVFEIHEKAPKGEFVGSVVADDQDHWAVLHYALTDYEANSGDASIFDIDEEGNIYLSSKSLNYETQKQYQVWATATDNGKDKGFENYSATTLVTIKIIDDPDGPEIIDDGKKSYDVKENTVEEPIKDTEIACYEVRDEDKGQVATLVPYVTDNGDTDADRLFDAKIKKNGSKYELCLIVNDVKRLNYESIAHTHSINVNVMDADKLTAHVTKTINLIDVNEMPIISGNATFSFYENKGKDYVIGRLYSDDVDTSKVFTQNKFTAIGGDTELFDITEDGKIITKRNFDYEEEKNHTFELEVALSDKDVKTAYPKLTTTTTIQITLKDLPEVPEITSKEFEVKENSDPDVLIGVVESSDPDGNDKLLFELAEESPYVIVKPNGEIRVKEGADIDYEKMQEFTITVTVRDEDGLESDGDIVIKVIDENEAPKIEPQEFTFPEDSKPGTKKGPVEAKDPDTKNPKYSDLKFYPVEENEKFEVKPNGDIVLKGELDYEDEKSYVITVRVTDGEFEDTTDITVNVGNVIEKSDVEITRAETGNSVYLNPKKDETIYTNKDVISVEWKQDGKTMSSLDSLKEGCQYIIKSYKAPNKDVAGADTIEVCYSTAAPIVDIDASKTKVTAENIYTIVENVDKKDSSIYVNNKNKDVKVSVKDTVSGYSESFKVDVVLDTVAVSSTTVKDMVDISKSEIKLEKNPKSDVYEKPIGDKTKVSYDKVVNGDTVTVSYYVDEDGEIVKTAVFDEDGKKTMTEVIEVSTEVEVKGKKVTVSYKADAETGKILYADSEGNLMVETPKSSSSKSDSKDKDEVDLKTGVGAFTVTYDAKGEEGNKTIVSYVIDEKGKVVANDEGDRGYLVTYTFTNKYGNTAEKSVFMVLDKLAPIVKILSPSDGEVVFANFVDVDWCIAIDGDEKNCVKQDTLNFQSLERGVNTIKRIYRDKAGNETIAEINVMMKKAKDVNINLEKPMVIVSIDSVNKYYESNPPDEDQRYAVSILNPKTQKEKEVVKGNVDEVKKGSGDEPYPGYDGHIGPTVTIDMKLPIVSAVGGLATLDDIIINGNMIAVDGVDADGSEKISVNEYVEKYCSSEFQEELGKDYSKARLYATTARVTLWFYTTGGVFVDKYQFDYEVDDPDYVDKAGLVKFFFEMKPDINGELRDKSGRLYGTGPYIVKTKVDLRSQQRCVVPPITEKSKVGDVLKSSDEMLKRFGYRRPVLRGNEKGSKSSSKKSSSKKK